MRLHSHRFISPPPLLHMPKARDANTPIDSDDPSDGCYLTPNKHGRDDGPAILQAFKDCGKDSKITFSNDTFNIGTVMDTRGLKNVTIDLRGTLLVRSMSPFSAIY